MKLIFTLSLIAALALPSLAAERGNRLTLDSIFNRVEAANLNLLSNREFLEQAQQGVARERAALLPRIDLNASQIRQRQALIGSGFDDFGFDPILPPSNRFDVGLRGSLSLVNPEQIARFRRAIISSRVANLEFESFIQDLLFRSGQLYFSLLRDQERMEAINANIAVAESNLELAQRRFQAGASPRIDVARAEVRLAREQQAGILQESRVTQSRLQLLRFLNLPLGTQMDIDVLFLEAHGTLTGPDDLIRDAAEQRRDLSAERERIRERQTEVRAARWERFPAVTLFGEYGYANDVAFTTGSGDTWQAGIALTMPIFEGLRIRSNERLARSRLRQQQLLLDDLKKEIEVTLMSLITELNARQAQIEVAERGLELAREELSLAQERFAQGASNNFELVEAQAGLALAADALVEAKFLYNLGRLELAYTTGNVRDITAGL